MNTNDNSKLTKLLFKGFKRSVFWSEYKSKIQTGTAGNNNLKIILLDSSFQGVNRLFVMGFDNTAGANRIAMNSNRKFALPRKSKETVLEFYKEVVINGGIWDDLNQNFQIFNQSKTLKYH